MNVVELQLYQEQRVLQQQWFLIEIEVILLELHSLKCKYKKIITSIVPVTAHVAFDKACDLFGIKIIKIPVDSSFKVDLKLLKNKINSNTICIVGSFPNYAHGICDDIEKMSIIAVTNKIPLHVDACLGGFLTSFYSNSNIKFPKFDFLLEGKFEE